MLWFYYALAAALLWAIVGLLDKVTVSRVAPDPMLFLMWTGCWPGV